jgi:tetratricopeptide (TPR) repeat protein
MDLRFSGRWLLLVLVLGTATAEPARAQGASPDARFDARMDTILVTLERPGRVEAALAAYREVEREVLAQTLTPHDSGYVTQQRMLAYVLLRQGNLLRQLDRGPEALALAERELTAARASGDALTAARTEFSLGTTLLANREIERGREHLERARELFAGIDAPEGRQGLGWYWIIRADLARVGLMEATPEEVIGFAEAALEVLLPVENWAGVARSYAARAHAWEQLGRLDAAAADREAEARYTALADRREP